MNKKGFTLVELIAAAMISSVILQATLVFALGAMRSGNMSAGLSKNIRESSATLGIITKEVRAANAISPSSTASKLILVSGSDLFIFEFTAGKIKRSKNASGQFITTDGALEYAEFLYPECGLVRLSIKPSGIGTPLTSEVFCRNA